MSLRKPPRLTPALLAANRANALKSTGPRTSGGKQAVLLSGLRHGGCSRSLMGTVARATLSQQLEFARLYAVIYYAVCPEDDELELVTRLTGQVYRTKRMVERTARSKAFQAEVLRHHAGWLPLPWKLRVRRPGWVVTLTVRVQHARGPAGSELFPFHWWDGKQRLHARVKVRSTLGRVVRPAQMLAKFSKLWRILSRPEAPDRSGGGRPSDLMAFKAGILQIMEKLRRMNPVYEQPDQTAR